MVRRFACLCAIALAGLVVTLSMPGESAEQELNGVSTGSAGDVSNGRLLARQCLGCHSLDGSRENSPSWRNLYGSEAPLQDGSRITVDDSYIRESIRDPNAKVSAGFPSTMPAFSSLSDQDILDLIAYIKTLRAHQSTPPSRANETVTPVSSR